MEQSTPTPQISIERDWNQAPNGSIKTTTHTEADKPKLSWWVLGIIGAIITTVIGDVLLKLFNLK